MDSYAEEPVYTEEIFEPIPFEETIKHDEDVKYHEYLTRPTEPQFILSEPIYYGFTQNEIDLLARMCMSEASILSSDAKHGVVHTAIARYKSGQFGNSIEEVINAPCQYSTADNGEPSPECYDAVKTAIKYFDTAFPKDMYYFRENQYHTFGVPYENIGTTYFSTSEQ